MSGEKNLGIWSQDQLKNLLSYDPDTGIFAWAVARGTKIKPGFIAGCPNTDGYIKIVYMRRTYSAHRLAFLYMTGSYPEAEVDHVDGNPQNNKWANLRACSRQENMQNKLPNKGRKIGSLVGANRNLERWISRISSNGTQIHIGVYETEFEAHQAYLVKKAELHKFNPTLRIRS